MSIEKIMARIVQDAEERAKEIAESAKIEAEAVWAAAAAEAGRVRQQAVASGRKEVDRETARIRAQAEMVSREFIRHAREEIVEECFLAAEQELARVRDSAVYRDVVERLLENGVGHIGGDLVEVLSSRKDHDLIREIVLKRSTIHPEVRISGEDITTAGGVIVRSGTGHVEVDNTFEERLGQLRSGLLFEVARVLEGQESDR